MLDVKD